LARRLSYMAITHLFSGIVGFIRAFRFSGRPAQQ